MFNDIKTYYVPMINNTNIIIIRIIREVSYIRIYAQRRETLGNLMSLIITVHRLWSFSSNEGARQIEILDQINQIF